MDFNDVISSDKNIQKLQERFERAHSAVEAQEARIADEQKRLKDLRDRERHAKEKFGSALLFSKFGDDIGSLLGDSDDEAGSAVADDQLDGDRAVEDVVQTADSPSASGFGD